MTADTKERFVTLPEEDYKALYTEKLDLEMQNKQLISALKFACGILDESPAATIGAKSLAHREMRIALNYKD